MFQFSRRFAFFINFSSFIKPDTENNANFDAMLYQANAATSTSFSKEDKILIRSPYERYL